MAEPVLSKATYLKAYIVLLALTLATVLIGYINMGAASMVVAVAIATIQACLVAGFFMHAIYDSKLVWVVIAGGIVWFLIFMTLTITDYLTRGILKPA